MLARYDSSNHFEPRLCNMSKIFAFSPRGAISIFFAALLSGVVPACSEKPELAVYSVGTGASGGVYQDAGRSIARSVNGQREVLGFSLDDVPSPGSAFNIDSVVDGTLDFGIAQADHQFQAYHGLSSWESQGAQSSLRSVLSLYTESVTLLAGADTEIRTISDLAGKRVDIGEPGSGTRLNAIDALEAAGMNWQSDIRVREEPSDERLASFIHGDVDAFFYTVGHPTREANFATYSVRGARFVQLEGVDRLLESKSYYSTSSIPVGLYPRASNLDDVQTFGTRATLVTSADVPDEIVYALVKAVHEKRDALGNYNEVLDGIQPSDLVSGLTAPLHPGAERFYREIGLELPDSVD